MAQQTAALEERVSTLQTALKQCAEVAGRWKRFGREFTVAVAVLMLALGFTLGVYREPIQNFFSRLAQGTGLVKPASDDPYAAYQTGQYAVALRLARPLAEQGNARAQATLGLLTYFGRGGARQDDKEAALWFRRAAEQGDPVAEFYLGLMYSQGRGVPQDYAEALKWYRLAADQGYPQAMYNLGLYYATGDAGERDIVTAYMWFDLAAAHFPADDPGRKAAVTSRNLLLSEMTREQLAEAQRRAREWTEKK